MLGALTAAACALLPGARGVTGLIAPAWDGYQRRFVDPEGRVRRPLHGDDTVSEGQAYALLLAALLGDRGTFARVLAWTERHLSRRLRFGDHLLAWRWTPEAGVADWHSAADADVDYALALVLGFARWGQDAHGRLARAVLDDILALETAVVAGTPYLLAGTWRQLDGLYVVNPSYLSPAHFRVFARVSGDPRWEAFLEASYGALAAATRQFDGRAGIGLVPDWLAVRPDGTFVAAPGLSPHFGWDAIRVAWRLGLDAAWFGEPRARALLGRLGRFYARQADRVAAVYTYQGEPVEVEESLAAAAMATIALTLAGKPEARAVAGRLGRAFDRTTGLFANPDDYYQNSLALLTLVLLADIERPPAPPVPLRVLPVS